MKLLPYPILLTKNLDCFLQFLHNSYAVDPFYQNIPQINCDKKKNQISRLLDISSIKLNSLVKNGMYKVS